MDVEITIPSPGESITEVVLESWLVEDGAFVKKGEDLFEVESEKATLSIPAEISGTLIRKAEEGQTLQVGDVACLITAAEEDSSSHAQSEKIESTATSMPKAEEPQKQTATASLSHSEPIESPRSEKGETAPSSNEEEVQGEAVVEKITQQGEDAESEVRKEERKKLSPLRKKIAQRLVAVRNETAMLTTFNEVNMSRVKAIRESYQSEFVEKHGVKLGYMSFFIKAVSIAMKNFPDINAMIDGDEVVHFNYLDMGVSVSAPKGLVVPVIRNADQLSLWDIEKEIKRLAGKARDLTLSIDEMSGGTFTITNGGVFGSLLSTPILNPPQSAILGMHNIVERPIAVEGKVEIHPMMYVALSYDHRIVDGRESVGFLKNVKELIEDPVRFLLEI